MGERVKMGDQQEDGEEVKERLAPTCLNLTHLNQPAQVSK
jgi:hypothetical protein